MDYEKVLNDALTQVIEKLNEQAIDLETEGDFQSYLFHECANILKIGGVKSPPPLPLFSQHRTFGRFPDISLGDVLVELKFQSCKDNVFSEDVIADIEKLKVYRSEGRKSHFIMIELAKKSPMARKPLAFPGDRKLAEAHNIKEEWWDKFPKEKPRFAVLHVRIDDNNLPAKV